MVPLVSAVAERPARLEALRMIPFINDLYVIAGALLFGWGYRTGKKR